MNFQEEEIKKILVSVPGQRLLACLLLIQPLTAEELRNFFDCLISVFSKRNRISNMANEKNSLFNPIFDFTDLYDKDRTLKRAVKSGLIIEVPVKKNWDKTHYYFLNSDLVFNLSSDGLKITNNRIVFPRFFNHHIYYKRSNQTRIIKEYIAFQRPTRIAKVRYSTLKEFSTLCWWLIRHPRLISDTIDIYRHFYYGPITNPKHRKQISIEGLPKKWKTIFKKADGEVFMRQENPHDSPLLYPWFNTLINNKISLSFTPSYSIFECFSNFKEHAGEIIEYNKGLETVEKRTPMTLLKKLTSEEYEIIPQNRQCIFSSILRYEDVDERTKYIPQNISEKQKLHLQKLNESEIKSEETCWIDKNIEFTKEVVSRWLKFKFDVDTYIPNYRRTKN
ncbi:MAG TPA: hypothetical protein VMY59_02580 [Candidatus Thermoplasmatota archaeon]|nr:hypothetical protein [Candidatus Thermoplasmatota archaeon]